MSRSTAVEVAVSSMILARMERAPSAPFASLTMLIVLLVVTNARNILSLFRSRAT